MNELSLSKTDTSIVKGIAICAMLFHHLWAIPIDGVLPYSGVLSWIGELGKVCVAMFLFCSGYGLSKQYREKVNGGVKGSIGFIVKRLYKFYVNYWMVFIIFVPISVLVFNRPLTAAYGEHVNLIKRLFYDLLGMQGFHSYNVHWWFNQLIIVLYLFFPILYYLVDRFPWITLCLGLTFLRFGYSLPTYFIDIYVWQFPFLLGILWCRMERVQLSDRSRIKRLLNNRWAFSAISLSLVIILIILRMFGIIPYWGETRVDPFLSCAIVLLVISTIRTHRPFNQILCILGKYSSTIYMTHGFFNNYWHPEWLHTSPWMRCGINFLILMGLCLLVGVVLSEVKRAVFKF